MREHVEPRARRPQRELAERHHLLLVGREQVDGLEAEPLRRARLPHELDLVAAHRRPAPAAQPHVGLLGERGDLLLALALAAAARALDRRLRAVERHAVQPRGAPQLLGEP